MINIDELSYVIINFCTEHEENLVSYNVIWTEYSTVCLNRGLQVFSMLTLKSISFLLQNWFLEAYFKGCIDSTGSTSISIP